MEPFRVGSTVTFTSGISSSGPSIQRQGGSGKILEGTDSESEDLTSGREECGGAISGKC